MLIKNKKFKKIENEAKQWSLTIESLELTESKIRAWKMDKTAFLCNPLVRWHPVWSNMKWMWFFVLSVKDVWRTDPSTLPQGSAWLVTLHGESVPVHPFSLVSAISYLPSPFFFKTSTFLHDFNFFLRLQLFFTTLTLMHDFNFLHSIARK